MPVSTDHLHASRALVVRAGALGDTLMITPLLRRLRREQAGLEIHLLCSSAGAALLESNENVSRIYTLRNRNLPYLLSPEKQGLAKQLRANRYQYAILLESAPRYRELLERAGIEQIRSFNEIPFDQAQHSVVNNLRVGGFPAVQATDLDLEIRVSDAALETAGELLSSLPKPRIGIHAGYGPASKKRDQTERLRGWKTANFREVAGELVRRGASIVLTGSTEDRPVCEEIAEGLPLQNVRVLAGQTSVRELPALIKALDLLISVDSGPAHIATAVGTPLIVLWGPGILSQTGPVSAKSAIQVLNANVPCAPCYGTDRMKGCRRNICMEQIQPPEVIEAAWSFLEHGAFAASISPHCSEASR